MSVSKLATALGTAVLLVGAPATYALAAQDGPGRPDKPGGAHECEDGVDNDNDGTADFGGDADCGSARDNSEGPEEAEEPGAGPGTVIDPVLGVVGAVEEALLPAEEEPGEEEPPAEEPPAEEPPVEEEPGEEPPAEDPLAPVLAAAEELVGSLPPLPTQEDVEAAVAEVVGSLPPVQ